MVRAEAAARLRLRPLSLHRYTVLDVFTDTPLEGNALAVVHDADVLDEATMLRVARETRLSETTFVQTATAPGAEYRNRIFTTGGELPFAGHPSLGTAAAVAMARGEREARYVQQTIAGLQSIDVRVDGERASASMLQEPAVFGAEVDPAAALAAVGLDPADADPALPPQVVSTGLTHLLVPLCDPDALARVSPDPRAIDALLEETGAVVLYLAWCDPASGEGRARGLMRSSDGVEDPATGSAVGPLCAYLAQRTGLARIAVAQGVEMGRPSRLHAEIEGDRARVSGSLVAVVHGSLTI